MRSPLFVLLLTTFVLTTSSSAEDKLPPAVKPILEKAARLVKKNRDDFAKANEKPLSEARKELEALSTKLIKDGKATEAGLVLKQIESLDVEVMRMASAPPPVVGKAAPQKPLLERMAGKWNRTDDPYYYAVLENGTVEQRQDETGTVVHTSPMTILDPETAEFKAKGGWAFRCRMAGEDAMAVFEFDPSGKRHGDGIAFERMKTK